jgi:hypothetical protein
MSARAIAIPYEKQSDQQAGRTCGAACLNMVYRSFGMDVPSAEIWPAIAKRNRFGVVSSTTHLMTQDAVNRGFAAVSLQARHPLHVLRLCREYGIRAVLNHRLRPDSPTGHYSVFVDLDEKDVILHDPLLGPSHRLTHAELLELWAARFSDSEVAGCVLIAVASPGQAGAPCEFCRTPMLPSAACPRCSTPVGLQPSSVLGCLNDACIARMWNYVCCPACDYAWSFEPQTAHGAETGGTNRAAGTKKAPAVPPMADLNSVFAEMDKFCAHILSLPAVAANADVKRNLDFIAASKEQLRIVCDQEFTRRATRQATLAAAQRTVQEQREEALKKMEEADTPPAPVDGDTLGRALLKNLGLTR